MPPSNTSERAFALTRHLPTQIKIRVGVLALRTYGHIRADDFVDVVDVFSLPTAKPNADEAAS